MFYILKTNSKARLDIIKEIYPTGETYRLVLPQQITFLNKASLVAELNAIPKKSQLIIDARYSHYIDKEVVETSLSMLEIDEFGIGISERIILECLVNVFGGGPVGLNTLAAATGEEDATIADVTEPYLLQIGMIERTPRGRKATEKALKYFKK